MSLLNFQKINLDNVEDDIKKTLKNVKNKLQEFQEKFKENKEEIQEVNKEEIQEVVKEKIQEVSKEVVKEEIQEDKELKIKSDTLIDLEVSSILGNEYIPLINDLTRMITLQVIIQLMLSMRDSKEYPFFSQHFFELLFYIVLGLMTYWLVVRKLFKLK